MKKDGDEDGDVLVLTWPLEEAGWRVPTMVLRWFSLSSCSVEGR